MGTIFTVSFYTILGLGNFISLLDIIGLVKKHDKLKKQGTKIPKLYFIPSIIGAVEIAVILIYFDWITNLMVIGIVTLIYLSLIRIVFNKQLNKINYKEMDNSEYTVIPTNFVTDTYNNLYFIHLILLKASSQSEIIKYRDIVKKTDEDIQNIKKNILYFKGMNYAKYFLNFDILLLRDAQLNYQGAKIFSNTVSLEDSEKIIKVLLLLTGEEKIIKETLNTAEYLEFVKDTLERFLEKYAEILDKLETEIEIEKINLENTEKAEIQSEIKNLIHSSFVQKGVKNENNNSRK